MLKAERDACLLEHTTGALQSLSNRLSSWCVQSILIMMILWRGWIPLRLGIGFFDKLLSMLDYGKQLMLPSRQTAPQSHRYSCLCLFECVLFTLKTGLGVLQLFFLLDSPKNMQAFHQNFHSLSFPAIFLQVKTLSMVLSSDFFLTWTNAHFSNMESG